MANGGNLTGSLPRPLAKLVRHVPEQVREAESSSEVMERLGESPVGATLRQTCNADFSELEWGALLESRHVVSRLANNDEKIQIDYQGPATGQIRPGLNELPVNQWSQRFGIPAGYRVMLFSLVRQLQPKNCLELGTAAGFSTLHMVQGLALNGRGVLHTIEGDENSYAVGRKTLWLVRDRVRPHLGFFEEVMDEILPDITPLDLIFIDGAHTGTDEVGYAARLSEHLNPGAVVVYDDIHWSDDMVAAWEEIRNRPEVSASLDFGKFGLVQTKTAEETGPAFHFTAVAKGKFGATKPQVDGLVPENTVWIFGSPRSGTTWLKDMMQATEDCYAWNEPFVGDLFGNFYYERAQEGQLKAKAFIMGEPVRAAWIEGIRRFVLEVSKAQFPSIGENQRAIVKEPNGSVGAPLLAEAFPESGLVLLIRDPRDVVASFLDASRKDAWLYERRSRGWIKESGLADDSPNEFAETIAGEYEQNVGNSKEAYEAHEGPKVLVRYEELVEDTLGTMQRIYKELGIEVEEAKLKEVVEQHSWENIPEEKKGEGKFYRKGTPGGWKEDLTTGQIEKVEEITGPSLEEFYPGS